MNAVVSGQAGVAILLRDGLIFSLRASAPSDQVPRRSDEVRYLLGDANDLRFLENTTLSDVQRWLEEDSSTEEALHLTLVLLDQEHEDALRTEAATSLAALLETPRITVRLEGILYAHPLPSTMDRAGSLAICDVTKAAGTKQLLEALCLHQEAIAEIVAAWSAIPAPTFGNRGDRERAQAIFVREGLFREIAVARQARSLQESTVDLVADKVPLVHNHRSILSAWASSLLPVPVVKSNGASIADETTLEILGYGSPSTDNPTLGVSPGFIRDHDRVINTHTGATMSQGEAALLIQDGQLTLLPKPIPHKKRWSTGESLVVLTIDRSQPLAFIAQPDTGKASNLIGFVRKGMRVHYAFTSTAFDHFCDGRLTSIVQDALARGEHDDRDTTLSMVRAGLALRASHPELNALEAHLAGRSDSDVQRARSRLATETERKRFENMLRACERAVYRLKYDGGTARSGGLDTHTASKLLRAFEGVQRFASKRVAALLPFLKLVEPVPPRLLQLQHGSATLVFTTDVAGETLAQRVARYYELQTIGEIVGGEESDFGHDERVTIAQQRAIVVQPDRDVELRHHRVDRDLDEGVGDEGSVEDQIVETNDLRLFGFQSGLWRNAAQIEVTIAPARQIRFAAEGQDPTAEPNLDFLYTDNHFMFRPASFWVRRDVSRRGIEKFTLKEVIHLEKSTPLSVNAVPSAFADGAYCLFESPMTIRHTSASIEWPTGRVDLGTVNTLQAARAMIAAYASLERHHELAAQADCRYVVAARPRPLPGRERLLLALRQLDGQARVKQLVEVINERGRKEGDEFGWSFTSVRDNNTRREVLRNPELLQFVSADEDDDGDRKTIKITTAGVSHLAAFLRGIGRDPA